MEAKDWKKRVWSKSRKEEISRGQLSAINQEKFNLAFVKRFEEAEEGLIDKL